MGPGNNQPKGIQMPAGNKQERFVFVEHNGKWFLCPLAGLDHFLNVIGMWENGLEPAWPENVSECNHPQYHSFTDPKYRTAMDDE